jgi:hypothetical protein
MISLIKMDAQNINIGNKASLGEILFFSVNKSIKSFVA